MEPRRATRTSVTAIRRCTAIGLTLLAVAALAACGSDDDDGGGAATSGGASAGGYGAAGASTAPKTDTGAVAGATATQLSIDAVETSPEQLGWSRRALTARSGEVTIALANPSGNQLPHAVEIEGGGIEKESATVQPGDDTSVAAELRPGRYAFYCPVGNHRELGMEGTLTVR